MAPRGTSGDVPPPASTLKSLVERYWDEHIAPEDVISPQTLADELAIERRYLAELGGVQREALNGEDKLTFDLFKRQREFAIEGFTYADELLPLRPFGGMPMKLAADAAETAQHSLGLADYERWLARVDAAAAWSAQARVNMRDGLRRGYLSPRAVVERMIAQLERLGRDDSDNIFYTPLRSMAGSVSAADRERITRQYNAAIASKLLPSIRALKDFLATEYLPKSRTTLGLAELPLGRAWYAHRLKRATGSDEAAADLNRLGMAELERLKAHALTSTPQTLAAADLLGAYQQLADAVQAKLPALFDAPDTAPPEFVAIDLALAPAASAFYRGGEPRERLPGALFIHAPGMSGSVSAASYLQEGVPGAHLRAVLLERSALPRFRRFEGPLAYAAGWDMYAAGLGEELGVYADEPTRAQWWALQMRCAAGLVLDTGIHGLNWTRDKALDYLRSQSGLEEADAQALIDGVAAAPGEAAACESGALKFRELKARTQQALGSRFDIREYHRMILEGGVLPPDDLDARVKAWMESSR